MITRPLTDELVRDCCRELMEEVLPAIEDDTVKLRVIMTVTVLSNAAVRAAHEIAWMRDETEAALAFARDVRGAHADERIAAALAETEAGPPASLELADVVDVYERAARAFDVALQAAHEAGDGPLLDRAAQMLRARVDTEKVVMADYAIVGR